MYFILDPGFLIMQYECNLYWTSWSTDSHSNETKNELQCSIQLIFQVVVFFFFDLKESIFSIFSPSGVGTCFRLLNMYIWTQKKKGEEVSAKNNSVYMYFEWWSGHKSNGTEFFCELHIPVYFVVPFSCCIFVLNVHKPLHLSYWICWIAESCVSLSEKNIKLLQWWEHLYWINVSSRLLMHVCIGEKVWENSLLILLIDLLRKVFTFS